MYFRKKNNTNIDKELKKNSSLLFFRNKLFWIILVIIVLLIVMLLVLYKPDIQYNLTLVGDKEITIYQGSDYIEPGYDVSSSNGEALLGDVVIHTDLDNNVIGEYTITYTIGDVTEKRVVNVIEKPQEYIFIYLNSVSDNINVYLKLGDEYVEPGYQAYSTTGVDLTSQVTVSGKVDIAKKGTYKLIYSLIDLNDVTVSASRTVIVMDSDISLTLDSEEYTNKEVSINVSVIDEYFDYMILPDNTKVTKNNYSYKVDKNGKYIFKIYNKKGTVKESSIEVKNIDKEMPTGNCSGSYKDGVSTIIVNAKDNVGIEKYVIEDNVYTTKNITINSELKTVNINIYDKAGNVKSISCNLEDKNIYEEEKEEESSSSGNNSDSSNDSSNNNSDNSSNNNSGNGSVKNSNNGEAIQLTGNISVNYYKKFSYWLYVPNNSKNLPVVVYLPGLGERGNDYYTGAKTAIANGPINEIKDHNYSYNAIVIHMQVPAGGSVYSYFSDYVTLINSIVDKYGANKNKISIIGFSHGCYGMVNMLQSYPSYFSAAVFVGCAPNKKNNLTNYTRQPVWAFVGGGDGDYDYNDQYGSHYSLENFVNGINSAGGNAKYTSVKSKANVHNIMNDSYSILRDNEYNVINWMISQ